MSYIKKYGNLYAQTYSYANGQSIFENITSNSLSIAGNVSAGNLISLGNVSGNYILGNGAFLTGLPEAYGNANVANYLPTYTGNLNPGNLYISGGQANLGPAANVKIAGGTLNYYLTSDGAGGLAWAAGTGNITGNGSVAGADQQIQFNNGTGNFAASAALKFDYTANILRVTGAADITGNIDATGNISATYFLGNGAFLTGLDFTNYSNANVANYLPLYTGNLANSSDIIALYANAAAQSNSIANLQAQSYSNANVAAYLPNYQGLISNIEFRSNSSAAAALIVNDRSLTIGGNLLSYIILPDDGNANSVAAELTNHGLGNVLISSGPADYEWIFDATGNLTAPGNIAAGNVITANYFIGNGAFLTGLPAGYSNANAAAYLASNAAVTILTTGNITTGANITGNYILGNGAFLTGIAAGYSNADVANYLPTYTGALPSLTGNITTTANIQGDYILGNGAFLTGIAAGYGNADVANYLASNANVTLTVGTGNITTQGNINSRTLYVGSHQAVGYQVAGNITLSGGALDNNANISIIANSAMASSYVLSLPAGTPNAGEVLAVASFGPYSGVGSVANLVWASAEGGSYGNSNVSDYLASNANIAILTTGNITTAGNITGSYFLGNGALLTGIVADYSNANVANYLVSIDNVAIGFGAGLNDQGSYTVAIGVNAGGGENGNAAAGQGDNAIAIGTSAGASAQGIFAVAIGDNSGTQDQGEHSVAIGTFAGSARQASSAVAIGHFAASADQGQYAIALGYNAGAAYQGIEAIAIGRNAGFVSQSNNSIVLNASGNIVNGDIASALYIDPIRYDTGNIGNAVYYNVDTKEVIFAPAYSDANVAAVLESYNGNALFGNITVSQDAVILGNLRVEGNTTYINVSNLAIEDKDIIVAANANATLSDLNGAGLQIGNITSGGNITFFYDSTGNVMALSHGANIANVLNVGGNIIAEGNVSGNYILGNGAFLTGISGGNYSNANVASYLPTYTGNLNSLEGNVTTVANISGAYILGNGYFLTGISGGGANLGNAIDLGTPSQGNLTSNAVTLTTTTTVTDGVALLNEVLGKLVPPRPSNFPAGQTLSVTTSGTSARITNYVQPDNTPSANRSAAAGTLITAIRSSTYTTNTITNAGPGDSGTLTAYLNGANAGSATFNAAATPNVNGTYSNLIITNNYDYNTANASIAAGFWYVFSSRATGTVPTGWNEIYISHSSVGNTAKPYWFYDSAAPGTPAFSNVSVTACATPTLAYTSTIPHYASGTTFGFGFSVNRLSGNTYPNSNNLSTGSAAGAFQAPATVTYAAAGVTEPLAQNLYVASGTVTANTTAGIVASGFGSSSTGPSVTVNNSYNSASQAFTSALAATVLYKNGNSTAIDEGNITVTSVGTGSGNAYRIINPGSGNTPAYTANATAFNSQSSTLQTYDATVVGSSSQGVMKHDQTNYSTGYLPAGPDLSSGRSGTQYFTFKFIRTGVSKFDIKYTGTVAGMWVALPGSVIDTSSGINGWMDMTQAYAGSGYPGVNVPGNGSDGCSLGGTVAVNTSVTNASKTCTFGTVSSSSTATNEIYVRIALTSGQSVTALSIIAATN